MKSKKISYILWVMGCTALITATWLEDNLVNALVIASALLFLSAFLYDTLATD